MIPFAAALPVLKSLLLNRYLWGAVLIGGVGYGAYAWAFARGEASRAPEVLKLKTERDEAKGLLEGARETARGQATAHATALTGLKTAQAETLAAMAGQLNTSEVKAKKLKKELDAYLTNYISPKADAACTVPAGFVRFHNLSTEGGADPTSPAPGLTLPGGGPTDADRASGVALSTIASTIASNYAECQARLEVIESWQGWYTRSLTTWKAAVEGQGKFKVIVPLVTPSPRP